ncbi:condensation domain-containing protein [Streptantibioticus parmotrematis]|uniref:condensation domain-containing protein n=1 Tax=Streptantibioticus parmotrematis TaxID=2873249 RepID=UPI0034030DF9
MNGDPRTAADTPGGLPLSATQEAMWVTWQMDPDKWEHIIPLAFQVTGVLDVERLRAAIDAVARRHPALRARVSNTAGGACLVWDGDGASAVPVRVRAVSGERDAAITAARAPFDLTSGPLARVEVLEGPGYTVLLLTVHHIVLDGTSIPLLLDDLRRAYAGEDIGGPEDPGPVVEHAARSREAAEGEAGEPLRAFWRDRLADAPEDHLLPAPGADGTVDPITWPLPLDPETAAGAARLADTLGVSRFTVAFAALFVVLRHHTGGDDLIISAPYHGRSDQALAGRVGFFVNVLPFRLRMRAGDTYEHVVRELRSVVRESLAHGALPLPSILRAAGLVGPRARHTTHQVVFEYWNTASETGVDVFDFALAHGDTRCGLSMLDLTDVADYRLTVMLAEGSTGSRMLWKDPAGAVGPDRIAALARDYRAVLTDMAADPRRTLADMDALLPPATSAASVEALDTPDDADTDTGDAPREATPATLDAMAAVWADVLGIDDLAPDESFFELGGHSLLAATLLGRIADRLGVELTMRDLFTHPQLGALAAVAESRLGAEVATASAGTRDDGWDEVFPASGFQESIWLAERLDPAHARYHIPLFWRVRGTLDPDALRAALALLVERHEILRTRFVDRDGRLHHEVGEAWVPEVEYAEPAEAGDDARRQWLRKWSDSAATGFVPAEGRLLAAALVGSPDGDPVLALCVHHLVLDGESVPLLTRELERCYRHAAAPGSPPPEPSGQYRDLVRAQRTGAGRARAEADLTYWQEHLRDAPAALGLPAPDVAEGSGNVPLRLAPDAAAKTEELGARWRTTAFAVHAAALAAVLHRASGAEDLTFGVPVADRAGQGAGDVLGPSLNTLVLRSRCTRETTYGELLGAVRDEVLDAFEHRHAPFEEVVRGLRPRRRPGRTPYVDCVLNNVSMADWSADLGSARLVPLDDAMHSDEASKFGLTVTFTRGPEGVRGDLAFRGDVIGASDAHALADELAAVIGEFPDLLTRTVRNSRLGAASSGDAPGAGTPADPTPAIATPATSTSSTLTPATPTSSLPTRSTE